MGLVQVGALQLCNKLWDQASDFAGQNGKNEP